MSWLQLSDIARLAQGRLVGDDSAVASVTTDTRALQPGQLFVALAGPRFDGHDFVAELDPTQAAGALVACEMRTSLPRIVVDDTLTALQRLSAAWRRQSKATVVALTGSNGKTTVKEMIAAILKQEGEVLATRGNLNNHIGVPLTLLSMRPNHAFAVVEMGANHPGEIAVLTAIIDPDIALVINAAAAHLEGFGSIEGVARAKGEIFAGLGDDGAAVINADDAYADYWRSRVGARKCLTFGLDAKADVSARSIDEQDLHVTTPAGDIKIRLSLPGRHNVRNALAAAAVAIAAGASLASIRTGLEKITQVRGRLVPRDGMHGARLLDDSYNANPGSFAAALEVLVAQPGAHWLVLGDMAELGASGEALHRMVGELARDAGVARLFALGALSQAAADAFGTGAAHFDSHAALVEALHDALGAGADNNGTILIKGSRSMCM
ncbi:MAG: UDP-N-acetylmuramoyl-tripeptide--D-alanyl-D-alanine ligase, partial [Gammaproteobacteria bacterium]|nr:UDP-N-acetylmuramoyl-tripeptide--D-alanyl-D-alanine ligase [Gammaproteobacteria bacterium]